MSRKGKVASELKLELVERYLNNEISRSQAARDGEVDIGAFRSWLRLYETEGPAGLLVKNKNNVYSKETKLAAVNGYLSGEEYHNKYVLAA